MPTVDILIIIFIAFISLALIYNRYVKNKKAKEKGINPGCCGCRYSNQCMKYHPSNKSGSCCSSNSSLLESSISNDKSSKLKSDCCSNNQSGCSCC